VNVLPLTFSSTASSGLNGGRDLCWGGSELDSRIRVDYPEPPDPKPGHGEAWTGGHASHPQHSACRTLFNSGRIMTRTPTVLQFTHWKAGSTWLFQFLNRLAPGRIILPQPDRSQFLGQPVIQGAIYPRLYVTRAEAEAVRFEGPAVAFYVLRDLRDTLVSWYFSRLYSHPPVHYPVDALRERLSVRTMADGLSYCLRNWLPMAACIQRSWAGSGVFTVRYEDLLSDQVHWFREIARHVGLDCGDAYVPRIVEELSFERQSGRSRGTEDVHSHFRKGIAGDWRNYLRGDLLAEFKTLYDDLLIETGYERDRDWGLELLDNPGTESSWGRPVHREISRSAPAGPSMSGPQDATAGGRCPCGSLRTGSYSFGRRLCQECGTISTDRSDAPMDLLLETGPFGQASWLRRRAMPPDRWSDAVAERLRTELVSARVLRVVETVLRLRPPPAKLLQVGCGVGTLLLLLGSAGYEVEGLEVDWRMAKAASESAGAPVAAEPLETCALGAGSYEVVIMDGVLRHLADPQAALRKCRGLMASDGSIVVQEDMFPAAASLSELYRSGSATFDMLNDRSLLHLFTEEGLVRLIQAAGLGPVPAAPGGPMRSPI